MGMGTEIVLSIGMGRMRVGYRDRNRDGGDDVHGGGVGW